MQPLFLERVGALPLERAARQLLVGLNVLLGRLLDDVLGKMRRLARTVPVGVQPVAHELLVEARLLAPDLVVVDGPEARTVGRQDLVAQDDRAIDGTELELRVGDDDAACAGMVGGGLVHLQRKVAQGPSRLFADDADRAIVADVLVMIADLGLG